jgi:hypothetical protein
MISLNPNLDFSQITQTSQRGVGRSSQRLLNEIGSLVVPASSKRGGASSLKKLAIGNKPVKIGASDFGTETFRI